MQLIAGVLDRWVSVMGDGSDESGQHWQYGTVLDNGVYKASTTAPGSTRSERRLHRSTTSVRVLHGFDDVRAGMNYDERVYAPASQGGAMLRRTLSEWIASGPTPGGAATATRDPRVTKTVEMLLDINGNALASTTTYNHDADLNTIETKQYDYAQIDQNTA